jgi:hypothetical protein
MILNSSTDNVFGIDDAKGRPQFNLNVKSNTLFLNTEELTMNSMETLYLAPETLYRLGNATSPLLSRMRPDDIDITMSMALRWLLRIKKASVFITRKVLI